MVSIVSPGRFWDFSSKWSFFCAVWMITDQPPYVFWRHLPSCLQTSTSPATHITRSVWGWATSVGIYATVQETPREIICVLQLQSLAQVWRRLYTEVMKEGQRTQKQVLCFLIDRTLSFLSFCKHNLECQMNFTVQVIMSVVYILQVTFSNWDSPVVLYKYETSSCTQRRT